MISSPDRARIPWVPRSETARLPILVDLASGAKIYHDGRIVYVRDEHRRNGFTPGYCSQLTSFPESEIGDMIYRARYANGITERRVACHVGRGYAHRYVDRVRKPIGGSIRSHPIRSRNGRGITIRPIPGLCLTDPLEDGYLTIGYEDITRYNIWDGTTTVTPWVNRHRSRHHMSPRVMPVTNGQKALIVKTVRETTGIIGDVSSLIGTYL